MHKIRRDIKRRTLTSNFEYVKLENKFLTKITKNQEKKLKSYEKINKLPRDSSKTRIRNFCIITQRSRGIYKDFGLSRIMFRELALTGFLPGIKKASW